MVKTLVSHHGGAPPCAHPCSALHRAHAARHRKYPSYHAPCHATAHAFLPSATSDTKPGDFIWDGCSRIKFCNAGPLTLDMVMLCARPNIFHVSSSWPWRPSMAACVGGRPLALALLLHSTAYRCDYIALGILACGGAQRARNSYVLSRGHPPQSTDNTDSMHTRLGGASRVLRDRGFTKGKDDELGRTTQMRCQARTCERVYDCFTFGPSCRLSDHRESPVLGCLWR